MEILVDIKKILKQLALGLFFLALMQPGAVADDSGYKFTGTVTSLPSTSNLVGDWSVAGRSVHVSTSTKIDQQDVKILIGVCVEVRGAQLANQSIDSSRITGLDPDKCPSGTPALDFYGTVESLPPLLTGQVKTLSGQWMVSGKKVIVSDNTVIDQDRGPVSVGSCVEVTGAASVDGSINATLIEVRAGQGSCIDAPGMDKADVDFRGVVTKIDETGSTPLWTVSGRKVQVSADTKVMPPGNPPVVNDCVNVQGTLGNLTVIASRIQKQGDGACKTDKDQGDAPRLIGLIEKLPTGASTQAGFAGDWTVSGQQVKVTTATQLDTDHGPIKMGVCVEVRGPSLVQVVQANYIETLAADECKSVTPGEFQMAGTIQVMPASLPGNITINNGTVVVTTNTKLDVMAGGLVVGACVVVRGSLQANGSILASSIEMMSVSGTCILPGGVVSSGSYSSFALSPGQIVSIFGLNIGPATELPLAVLPDNTVAKKLSNIRVLFDGTPSPILYMSMGQINAVVPCGVLPGNTVKVQVESNGAWSNIVTVPVLPAWPSIFTQTNSGRGPGAILNVATNQTRTINGANNPAAPSSFVEVYATGLGLTNTTCVDGSITPLNGPFPTPAGVVSATIGGKTADLQFAGSAPGFVTGLFQVNLKVPSDVSGPNLPIVLKVVSGAVSASSPDGVTIAVK